MSNLTHLIQLLEHSGSSIQDSISVYDQSFNQTAETNEECYLYAVTANS